MYISVFFPSRLWQSTIRCVMRESPCCSGCTQSASIEGPLHFRNITSREHESLALADTQITKAQRDASFSWCNRTNSFCTQLRCSLESLRPMFDIRCLSANTGCIMARHQKHHHKFLKSSDSRKELSTLHVATQTHF